MVLGSCFHSEIAAWLFWALCLPWLMALVAWPRSRLAIFVGQVVYIATGCAWMLEVGVVPWLANAVYFAPFFFLTWWGMARTFETVRWPLWLLFPVFWTLGGTLRQDLSPFPTTWLDPAYLLVAFSRLRQAAELGGIYLVGLPLCMLAGCLAEAVLAGRRAGWKRVPAERRVWVGGTAFLGVLLVLVVWGAWRLRSLETSAGPRVALVQAAIPQAIRNQRGAAAAIVERHAQLSMRAASREVDLVVWPESTFEFYLDRSDDLQRRVRRLVEALDRPLLLGVLAQRKRPAGDVSPTGSAYLLDTDGAVLARWDKRQLVPLAENLLGLERFAWIRRHLGAWLAERFHFNPTLMPGDHAVVASVPRAGWKVGVTICYGDVLPDLTRELQVEGADLLVVVSNEAWFADAELHQHLDMARFRAVETRLPVVRAANTGMTVVIAPSGEVAARLAPKEPGILIAEAPRTLAKPPSRWVPKGLRWILSALALAALGSAIWRDRHRAAAPHEAD